MSYHCDTHNRESGIVDLPAANAPLVVAGEPWQYIPSATIAICPECLLHVFAAARMYPVAVTIPAR